LVFPLKMLIFRRIRKEVRPNKNSFTPKYGLMKKIQLTLICFFLATVLIFAQTNVEKTLVKSFNLKGNTQVTLNLDGDIQVKERAGEIMRVQMLIGVAGSDAMLKSLITAGRYNLVLDEADNGLTVSSPGLARKITVRGESLKENISYVVYVPEDVTVSYGGEAASDLGKPAEATSF